MFEVSKTREDQRFQEKVILENVLLPFWLFKASSEYKDQLYPVDAWEVQEVNY